MPMPSPHPDPQRQEREHALRQLRAREEILGVAPASEPTEHIERYLAGELTLEELVQLRLSY